MKRAAALLLALAACSPGVRDVTPTVPSPSSLASTAGSLAYVTGDAVVLRDSLGRVRTLGTVEPGDGVLDLAWSGRYVGWLVTDRLFVHDAEDHKTGSTPVRTSGYGFEALGVTATGFVVVGDDLTMSFADPAAVVERGEHTEVPITGARGPTRLLAADATHVLVAGGGPDTVFDVDVGGHATRLFRGDVVAAGLAADGSTVVYATRTTYDDECTLDFALVVRDLGANREVAIPPPAMPRGQWALAESVTTAPDGRTYVAMTNEVPPCDVANEVHRLFVLDGGRWRLVDGDARWGAYAPFRGLALIRTSGALVVDGHTVARGVTLAAWAPLPG